jgi:hypothetical protein
MNKIIYAKKKKQIKTYNKRIIVFRKKITKQIVIKIYLNSKMINNNKYKI